MERLAGRYELVAEVARGRGRAFWHGRDRILDREVGVLVLDPDHPHADGVRVAAAAAARVEHPGLLRVIDADLDDGRVFVVSRWQPGQTLAQRLESGPLRPAEAATVVQHVADALAAAADAGVHHQVLDPRDVLFTDHGPVLVGTGIRAALDGVPVEADARGVDAWRLGGLLYAALTGRWPGHPCAQLPAAPIVDGRVARPRQVRAGIPRAIDDVAWRCLDPEAAQPLTTPAEVADALGPFADDDRETGTPRLAHVPWRRTGWAVVAGLVTAGSVLVGVQLLDELSRDEGAAPTPTPTLSNQPTPSATTTAEPLTTIDPVAATAYDPTGDGEENDDDAALSIDGDPVTAWRTVTYASRELGELKPGVGLLIDLGEVTDVRGVELELVGRGTDLQVLASTRAQPSNDPDRPTAGFDVVGAVRGAGDTVTLRTVQPVPARLVLVWLTGLPVAADGYQGGVAEVVLLR